MKNYFFTHAYQLSEAKYQQNFQSKVVLHQNSKYYLKKYIKRMYLYIGTR